jgi:hypothetical protein
MVTANEKAASVPALAETALLGRCWLAWGSALRRYFISGCIGNIGAVSDDHSLILPYILSPRQSEGISLSLGARIGGSGFNPTCTKIALSPRAETGNVFSAEMPPPSNCSTRATAAACVLGLADGPPVWIVTPSRNGISPRVPGNGFQCATSSSINLIKAAVRFGSASGNEVTSTSTSENSLSDRPVVPCSNVRGLNAVSRAMIFDCCALLIPCRTRIALL